MTLGMSNVSRIHFGFEFIGLITQLWLFKTTKIKNTDYFFQ